MGDQSGAVVLLPDVAGPAGIEYQPLLAVPRGGGRRRILSLGEGTTFATWSRVRIPELSETTKPGAVWQALRAARVEVLASPGPTSPFGLRLELGQAPGERLRPAKIVKPLVDGVVAALHYHDGSELLDLSHRLQTQLGAESAESVAELLTDEHATPLGKRQLLWARAAGVQWNPADDRCLALELHVAEADRRELSGRLIAIEER